MMPQASLWYLVTTTGTLAIVNYPMASSSFREAGLSTSNTAVIGWCLHWGRAVIHRAKKKEIPTASKWS